MQDMRELGYAVWLQAAWQTDSAIRVAFERREPRTREAFVFSLVRSSWEQAMRRHTA